MPEHYLPYVLSSLTLIVGIHQLGNLFKSPKISSWVIFGILVISTLISFNIQLNIDKEEKYSKNAGILSPASVDGKPLVWVLANDTIYFPTGFIDLHTQKIKYFPLKAPKGVGAITGRPFEGVHFQAWIENNKIKVNTTIMDTVGNVIAKMSENEWIVNRSFSLDRNFDDTSLEVKDNFDQIVFQIEISGNVVKMQGKFTRANGTMALAYAITDSFGNGIFPIILELKPGAYKGLALSSAMKFWPLFKYPSELHKGERNIRKKSFIEKDSSNIKPHKNIIEAVH